MLYLTSYVIMINMFPFLAGRSNTIILSIVQSRIFNIQGIDTNLKINEESGQNF